MLPSLPPPLQISNLPPQTALHQREARHTVSTCTLYFISKSAVKAAEGGLQSATLTIFPTAQSYMGCYAAEFWCLFGWVYLCHACHKQVVSA